MNFEQKAAEETEKGGADWDDVRKLLRASPRPLR